VLDTSFGGDGNVICEFNPIITITLTITLQECCAGDNKLVIWEMGNQVMRLNENEHLIIKYPPAMLICASRNIFQSDQKCCSPGHMDLGANDMEVARVKTDGTLDSIWSGWIF